MNLDIQCAELGRELSKIEKMSEKILNEAMAVLEEQGPYAMFLYVNAKYENVAKELEKKFLDFSRKVFNKPNSNSIFNVIKDLSNNLYELLFFHDLIRKALIYASYMLKARES